MSHIAVCQSQLPLPQWEWCPTVGLTPCSCPWPSSPATLTGPSSCGRAVQWCLANPLYCQRSINPRSIKETLEGSKNQVYVLLKLLKKLTAAKVTSYQLKWAVENKLKNTDVDSLGLGPSISLVMEHRSIREKFLSVSGDLSRMGYSA